MVIWDHHVMLCQSNAPGITGITGMWPDWQTVAEKEERSILFFFRRMSGRLG